MPWTENHIIELRSPAGCCFGERIEVGPDRPLPPDDIIARRLKWKPARLFIALDPPVPRARVVRQGRERRAARARWRAPARTSSSPSADDERSKEIEIDVDSGDSFTSERITVRAGEHLVARRQAEDEQLRARPASPARLPPSIA